MERFFRKFRAEGFGARRGKIIWSHKFFNFCSCFRLETTRFWEVSCPSFDLVDILFHELGCPTSCPHWPVFNQQQYVHILHILNLVMSLIWGTRIIKSATKKSLWLWMKVFDQIEANFLFLRIKFVTFVWVQLALIVQLNPYIMKNKDL